MLVYQQSVYPGDDVLKGMTKAFARMIDDGKTHEEITAFIDAMINYEYAPGWESDMNVFVQCLVEDINREISPYAVGCDGMFDNEKILSLKRYMTEGGHDVYTGEILKDVIKNHGIGPYKVDQAEMMAYVRNPNMTFPADDVMFVKEIGANTLIGYNRILKLRPDLRDVLTPHDFILNVKTIKHKGAFYHEYYGHIDQKTTIATKYPDVSYYRGFRTFRNKFDARRSYETAERKIPHDTMEEIRDWDAEDMEMFGPAADTPLDVSGHMPREKRVKVSGPVERSDGTRFPGGVKMDGRPQDKKPPAGRNGARG